MCQKFRERVARDLSSVASSGSFGFNGIEECGNGRRASQSQKHQTEVTGENKMRYSQQNARKTPPAKIGQHGFDRLTEWQPRVLHVCALQKSAGKQHERHQRDTVRRCSEMQ